MRRGDVNNNQQPVDKWNAQIEGRAGGTASRHRLVDVRSDRPVYVGVHPCRIEVGRIWKSVRRRGRVQKATIRTEEIEYQNG